MGRIVTVPKGHEGSAASYAGQITAQTPSGKEPPLPQPAAAPKIVGAIDAPTTKEQQADIVRYGVPVVGGILTGGLSFGTGLAVDFAMNAISEITARRLEAAAGDPGMNDIIGDIEAGGMAGGMDVGIQLAQRAIAYPFRKGVGAAKPILRRMFMPNDVPEDVEIANGVLSSLAPPSKRKHAWQLWKPQSGDPFGITPGTMNYKNKGIIKIIDDIARSSFTGGGVVKKFEKRSFEAVEEATKRYLNQVSKQMTDHEYGAFLRSVVGYSTKSGNLFKPVEAYKSYLYELFDNEIAKFADKTIDLSKLRKYIIESGSDDLKRAYLDSVEKGLLPPLAGEPSRVVKQTRTTVTKNVESSSDITRRGTRQNLLVEDSEEIPFAVRTKQGVQGEAGNITTTERVTDILQSPKMSEEEVLNAWKNISVVNAQPILREINAGIGKVSDETRQAYLKRANRLVKDEFLPFLEKQPDVKKYYDAATSFQMQKERLINHKILQEMTRKLADRPGGVMAYLTPGSARPAETYEKLLKLKEMHYFADRTIDEINKLTPDAYAKITKRLASEGYQNMGKGMKVYDENVLQPIRYRMLTNFVDKEGNLQAGRFLNYIKDLEAKSPEVLREVWGNDETIKRIHDFATTLDVMSKEGGKNIFIQLAQSSALVALGGYTMYQAYSGDDPKLDNKAIYAGTILLSPYVLSKVLTNPKLTAALNGALYEGARSTKLAITLRKIGSMGYASSMYRDQPSTERLGFFSSFVHSNEEEGR